MKFKCNKLYDRENINENMASLPKEYQTSHNNCNEENSYQETDKSDVLQKDGNIYTQLTNEDNDYLQIVNQGNKDNDYLQIGNQGNEDNDYLQIVNQGNEDKNYLQKMVNQESEDKDYLQMVNQEREDKDYLRAVNHGSNNLQAAGSGDLPPMNQCCLRVIINIVMRRN